MNEVVQSFSISGRTYDNAVAESFSASMKREGIYRTKYKSERQFMESIDTYIEFYNTKRHIARSITKRQSSLNRTLCKQDWISKISRHRVQKWLISSFRPPNSLFQQFPNHFKLQIRKGEKPDFSRPFPVKRKKEYQTVQDNCSILLP